MNKQSYPYRDFMRVRQVVLSSLHQADEPYVLVTGETGTGKTALLRDLRGDLDRARYRIFYFQEAKRLGAPGIVRVLARSLRADTSLYHAVALDRVANLGGDLLVFHATRGRKHYSSTSHNPNLCSPTTD
jgi:type II secretory pathway predicted ATPase ExeA